MLIVFLLFFVGCNLASTEKKVAQLEEVRIFGSKTRVPHTHKRLNAVLESLFGDLEDDSTNWIWPRFWTTVEFLINFKIQSFIEFLDVFKM